MTHQFHIAYVQAQFQGGGGHQGLEFAALQPLLGVQAMFPGQAAVVGGDMLLPDALRQKTGRPLRQAAGVHKDQGGFARLDQGRQPPVHFLPRLPGHDRLQGGVGEFQGQVEGPDMAVVHDVARGLSVACQEALDSLDGTLGGGQPDARRRAGRQGLQPLQGQRQMGPAFVGGQGVDLIDDDSADGL